MANKKIKLDFEIDGLKESAKNMADLEKNVELLNEELKKTDIGSEKFNDLSRAIAQTTSELRNAELAMEGLDMEQRAAEFGSFAAGIADTATGALGLAGAFGITNESSEKMVETLVTGMSVAQAFRGGIEGIISGQKILKNVTTNSTIAQGILNAVMNANPVFLLITGIGLLVGALAIFSRSASDAEKKQQMLNEAQNKANEAAAEQINALDLLDRKLQDNTLTREEQIQAVKDLQEQYPNLLQNIDAESASIEEVNQSIRDYNELVLLKAEYDALAELRTESMKNKLQAQTDAQTGQNEAWYDGVVSIAAWTNGMGDLINKQTLANARTAEATELAQKELDVYGDRIAEVEKLIAAKEKEMGVDKKALEEKEKAEKEAEEKEKKRIEDAKRAAEKRRQERIAAEKKAAEDLEKIQDDFWLRQQSKEDQEVIRRQQQLDNEVQMAGNNLELIKQLTEEAERDITAIRQRYIDERKAQEDAARLEREQAEEDFLEEYREATISEQESEITDVNDKYFRLISLAEQYGLDTKELVERQNKEIADINKRYTDEEVADWAEKQQAKLDIASQFAGGVNSLAQSIFEVSNNLGDQSEAAQLRRAKRQFNIQKALDITTAGINTAQAIVKAIAQFGPPPSPLGIAGIASASAIGIAQIAAIASKRFDGGGSSAAASAGSAAGVGGGATSAPTPPSINLFGQPNEGSQGFGQQEAGLRQQNVLKAIVVESDITNTQNRLSTYQQRSEIG